MHMELIVQFCKGLKRQNFKCALCHFLSQNQIFPSFMVLNLDLKFLKRNFKKHLVHKKVCKVTHES